MGEGERWGGPKLEQFRQAVQREFGHNLEKATPANVRDFLDKFQDDVFQETVRETTRARIELNETKTTYEEILKDFFARVLERPSDEALIMLWTLAFEMCFFTIEQHAAERLQSLFGDFTDSP
jgi:hypothetical protein